MMSRVGTVTTGSSGPTSYQDRVSSTSDSQDTPEQPNNSHLGFHAVCKTRRPGPHAILPPAPLETKHWTTVPCYAVFLTRERERQRERGTKFRERGPHECKNEHRVRRINNETSLVVGGYESRPINNDLAEHTCSDKACPMDDEV